jgi:hypothetical protein
MPQGPPEQTDTRGIAYREFRQILSVTLKPTVAPRSLAITAAPWSTLSEGTTSEFRGEFFNLLNQPNFLFAEYGPQGRNNSTILGTSKFGFDATARDPRQIQSGLEI